MQMGFNNDVSYRGLTLHIQTEDHGLGSKKITSQVFFSGAILESKTISYEDEIASIEEEAARDERIRTFMKALHRKFYQRINEGIYDEQLPLEAAPDTTSASMELAPAEGLDTPQELIEAEGFKVAGTPDSLGEEYERNSRGAPLEDSEFEPQTLAEAGMLPAPSSASGGFVQLGGLGSGSHPAVNVPARAPSSAARIAVPAIPSGGSRAFRGLDYDDDFAETLRAAVLA